MENAKKYSIREENLNVILHFIGVLMGVVAAFILFSRAIAAQNWLALFSYSLFISGILLSFGASSLYHFAKEPALKAKLRYLDHGAIYVMIAGCYSPTTLLVLTKAGFWGWGLFISIWICALVGIILNFRPMKKNNPLKTFFYVLMGAFVMVAIYPLIQVLRELNAMSVLWWICAGGALYVGGSIIYSTVKREFSHAFWHLLVLIAGFCFVMCINAIPLN